MKKCKYNDSIEAVFLYVPKHGGKRLNAGRKSKYKEETKTISFRVPKSLIEPITKYVRNKLVKIRLQNNDNF